MVVACLPYLALKIAWLTGHPTGASDPAAALVLLERAHMAGNAVSTLLELVAVVAVVALTSDRARQLLAAVVLAPMWVGTGLLVPVGLGVPVGLVRRSPSAAHRCPPTPECASGSPPWSTGDSSRRRPSWGWPSRRT
ncbi:hypothetical protein ACQPX6_16860 [Actinomycetospora sp. CA-101289]|uniref:hypothetical protein n=1 Tax=Actinomycetospora sp. CA-101289 TaxID=3239893 RepID=UPI003D95FB5B